MHSAVTNAHIIARAAIRIELPTSRSRNDHAGETCRPIQVSRMSPLQNPTPSCDSSPVSRPVALIGAGPGGLVAARWLLSQGFGAGDKEFPQQANVLRVLIGELTGASEATTITMLEANIDDSSPQVLGYAMERLLTAGALDVTLTPVLMKKNRMGTIMSIMAVPEQAEQLAQILFAETTTLGIRSYSAARRVLARETREVATRYGKIRIKRTEAGGFAPEYDDCRCAAAEHNVPLRVVMAEASGAFSQGTSTPE